MARHILIEIIGLTGVRYVVILHARLVLPLYYDLPNVTDATPGPHGACKVATPSAFGPMGFDSNLVGENH